jgi:GT2 family glycosyltransferase
MEQPRIGILILNFNGSQWLSPLYRSIQANHYPNALVYLIDNASQDDSVELTLRVHPEVTVMRMPRNLGYCMAYNLVLPHVLADGCEWIIWSNNDVLLESDCLNVLAGTCLGHRGIGVAGPAFLTWDGAAPNAYMLGNHRHMVSAMNARSTDPIDADWVEGSFLMVSRHCLETTGPLDPFLFTYWEDADFCRRARYRGNRVVLVPGARARHFGGASWNRENLMGRRQYLLARNSYVFKLANPERSFGRNLLAAFHHLGVCIKPALTTPSNLLCEMKYFLGVMGELPAIYKKWDRDRTGKLPAPVIKDYEGLKVEVLPGREP